ncbi:MAG: hypothetical protein MHM6MM_000209 [Cercozoa sp. M6MM]
MQGPNRPLSSLFHRENAAARETLVSAPSYARFGSSGSVVGGVPHGRAVSFARLDSQQRPAKRVRPNPPSPALQQLCLAVQEATSSQASQLREDQCSDLREARAAALASPWSLRAVSRLLDLSVLALMRKSRLRTLLLPRVEEAAREAWLHFRADDNIDPSSVGRDDAIGTLWAIYAETRRSPELQAQVLEEMKERGIGQMNARYYRALAVCDIARNTLAFDRAPNDDTSVMRHATADAKKVVAKYRAIAQQARATPIQQLIVPYGHLTYLVGGASMDDVHATPRRHSLPSHTTTGDNRHDYDYDKENNNAENNNNNISASHSNGNDESKVPPVPVTTTRPFSRLRFDSPPPPKQRHAATSRPVQDSAPRVAQASTSAPSTGPSVAASTVPAAVDNSTKPSVRTSAPQQRQQHQQHQQQSQPAWRRIEVNQTPFLVLELVGRGGSSKVYKVLGPKGRLYALKAMRSQSSAQHMVNVRNEIKLLRRLRGKPHVIQLIDAQVMPPHVMMVFEFGEIDLASMLRRLATEEQRRSSDGALRTLVRDAVTLRFYWRQMLLAVQTIHDARIVHGDLKPANFLFVRGELKLIDFGIAKALSDNTTNILRDSQVGTLNYMSPEAILEADQQVHERSDTAGEDRYKLSRAADVWSLGCILFQMVFARTPFSHIRNTIKKLHAITNPSTQIPFPSPNLEDPECPKTHKDAQLVRMIRACLSRDPRQRPSIPELLQHPFLSVGDALRCTG